ncbi:MAG: DoxX family protein [Desulfuromonas sp.]|nr:DoxX family protein [Desulfuromonas sp.]
MFNATFVKNLTPRLLSLMRLSIAFLFIQHGGQKLFGYPVPMPGPPLELFSLIGVAGVLEFFGGLLLLLGLFTRGTAFILSGLMAFAYFIGHAGKGFWPLANQGELAVAYCFVFLYLAAAGGGPWSLDRLRGKD